MGRLYKGASRLKIVMEKNLKEKDNHLEGNDLIEMIVLIKISQTSQNRKIRN